MNRSAAQRRRKDQWLSERRRSATSASIAVGATMLLLGLDGGWVQISGTDVCGLVMLAYLLVTSVAFSTGTEDSDSGVILIPVR